MKIHRLLTLLPALLIWPAYATQVDISAPPGSSANYADTIVVLPNGNIVVVDHRYSIPAGVTDVGAVYLLDGATLAVISVLTGSTVGDQVGSGGVTVLSNGNFVVSSSSWDNGTATNAGAVTWGSATTGVSGTVSASNSLIGGTTNDAVSGVTALTNGHYVVASGNWDNPTGPVASAGAVTWGNGNNGSTVGLVTESNSLLGASGVTPLTNGHYVGFDGLWDNPSGPVSDVSAVKWCNGSDGSTVGLITASNSLIGGTASAQVGRGGVTALTNGNYVVRSPNWDHPNTLSADVGAVTWGDGITGTVGVVTPSNSLIGFITSDQVGSPAVTALTNGDYMVRSNNWDNPAGFVSDAGALSYGDGTAVTITGFVSKEC